jgi:hypothetical protein
MTKPQVIGISVPLYNCPIIEARISDNTDEAVLRQYSFKLNIKVLNCNNIVLN